MLVAVLLRTAAEDGAEVPCAGESADPGRRQ